MKTKTDLDDLILKKSYFPFSIFLMLISLRITLNQIEFGLSEVVNSAVNNVVYTAIIAVIGYLIYAFFDLIISRAFKKFAERTKSSYDKKVYSL